MVMRTGTERLPAPLGDTNLVFRTLADSPQTTILRQGSSGEESALVIWTNHDDLVHYPSSGIHTLSLYLRGGFGTFRRDRPSRHGAPGRVCVMPAGRESDWVVEGGLSHMHLYFTPMHYARIAEETFDMAPRLIEPSDRLLILEPWVERVCHDLVLPLNWDDAADRVAMGQAANLLLVHLLRRHSRRRNLRLRGGLAPAVLRRVEDYVEANLDRALTVAELARQAELSEFHFARMFRQSTGLSPHEQVREQRLRRARDLLLETNQPIGEIATACGFSTQSHFGQSFRQRFGATPGAVRRQRRRG